MPPIPDTEGFQAEYALFVLEMRAAIENMKAAAALPCTAIGCAGWLRDGSTLRPVICYPLLNGYELSETLP